ncbi:MAG: hypothetical protein HY763_13815 [Planctomycetes bacterium]|nr:hypothetical protein [Planctomycetota bacterium]
MAALALAPSHTALADAEPLPATSAVGQDATPLTDLLREYFRTDDAARRSALATDIEQATAGSVAAVAAALGELQLWEEVPDSESLRFVVRGKRGVVVARCRPPRGYVPTTAYPVVVEATDRRGTFPMGARDDFPAPDSAGTDPAHAVIRVHVEPENLDAADDSLRTGDYLRAVLAEVRRRLHVDSDRVVLLAARPGDPSAWSAVLANHDLLAGFAAFGSLPDVPYPAQSLPLLLENVRHVPVLLAWRRPGDSSDGTGGAGADAAALGRYIADLARRQSLPLIGMELADADVRSRLTTEWEALLTTRRKPLPRQVSHWFRFAGTGHAAWLRETKHAGETWEDDQLSIVVSPPLDRERFITEVLTDQFAYLGGRIDGQTITIDTRGCEEIEVLFCEGMIDFAQPVTVRCNGKTRHRGLVNPGVRTLLAEAAADWDFQRPVWAKLTLTIHE